MLWLGPESNRHRLHEHIVVLGIDGVQMRTSRYQAVFSPSPTSFCVGLFWWTEQRFLRRGTYYRQRWVGVHKMGSKNSNEEKEKRKRDNRFTLVAWTRFEWASSAWLKVGNLTECRCGPPATKPYLSLLIPHCVRDFLVGIETGHIFRSTVHTTGFGLHKIGSVDSSVLGAGPFMPVTLNLKHQESLYLLTPLCWPLTPLRY
jgi:hypothetical protein